jgi:hypothetical protein
MKAVGSMHVRDKKCPKIVLGEVEGKIQFTI